MLVLSPNEPDRLAHADFLAKVEIHRSKGNLSTYVFSKATWTGNYMEFYKADNLTFSPVPEPATLSLLALGGLAPVRRKRK